MLLFDLIWFDLIDIVSSLYFIRCFAPLHYTLLNCAALHSTAIRYPTLYCTELYCTMRKILDGFFHFSSRERERERDSESKRERDSERARERESRSVNVSWFPSIKAAAMILYCTHHITSHRLLPDTHTKLRWLTVTVTHNTVSSAFTVQFL